MKISRCNYARFENSLLEFGLRVDDLFVVTPEFEKNPAFIEGLRVGAFEIIEIENIGQLKKVIGITDEMMDEWLVCSLEEDEVAEEVVVDVIPEAVPEVVEPDKEPEDQPDDEDKVAEEPPEGEPEEPVLAFTEDAQSWQAAVALVKTETDVEKLTFAIRNDERKSVKRACVARLAELREEKE